MGKAILYIAMSLDGYIAGPHDDLSFLDDYSHGQDQPNKGSVKSFDEFFANVGAIILGKRTYDWEVSHGYGGAHPAPKFVLTDEKSPSGAAEDVSFTNKPIKEFIHPCTS